MPPLPHCSDVQVLAITWASIALTRYHYRLSSGFVQKPRQVVLLPGDSSICVEAGVILRSYNITHSPDPPMPSHLVLSKSLNPCNVPQGLGEARPATCVHSYPCFRPLWPQWPRCLQTKQLLPQDFFTPVQSSAWLTSLAHLGDC